MLFSRVINTSPYTISNHIILCAFAEGLRVTLIPFTLASKTRRPLKQTTDAPKMQPKLEGERAIVVNSARYI
jgi:hypothetical protein